MMNYYKNSLKEFKKYIKQNKNCTKQDWNEYAHNNCLFSSFTIQCHEITDNNLKLLIRENEDIFEFLKSIFVIMPLKVYNKFNKIIKLNKRKKQEEINE